jgi:hypothetical protein
MSDWLDVNLDVLAADPAEIKKIEVALQEPCEELIVWYATICDDPLVNCASNIREVVAFKPTCNLGYVRESVNKARRFENSSKKSWGLVWSRSSGTKSYAAQTNDAVSTYSLSWMPPASNVGNITLYVSSVGGGSPAAHPSTIQA